MTMMLVQICSVNSYILQLIIADLSEKYEISALKDKDGRLIKFF